MKFIVKLRHGAEKRQNREIGMPALLTDAGIIIAERFIYNIAIDPLNPPINAADPLRRADHELVLWLCRPFVVTEDDGWRVMCLHPNQLYRLTTFQLTGNFHEAVAIAGEPLPPSNVRCNPYRGEAT